MKRNKKLLASIVAVILSLTVVFATACADTRSLDKLTVDTTAAKTVYLIGETFSYDGITVTVDRSDSDGKTDAITVTNYTVNSSTFQSTVPGTYAITVSYTEGEQDVSSTYDVKVLTSAELVPDPASYTAIYEIGGTLNMNNIRINYVETEVSGRKTTTNVTSSATINSADRTAIDMDVMDTYPVRVSYTKPVDNITVTSTINIKVKGSLGLEVVSTSTDTYTLDGTHPTASVDISQIEVNQPAQDGTFSGSPLNASDYTLELYLGQEKIPAPTTGTVYERLKGGAYHIVATKTVASQEVWGFTTIYVVDNVVSLTWDDQAEGTVKEQVQANKDSISKTLKFEVKYTSGETKTVSGSDVTFTEKLKTAEVGTEKVAKATYTELNSKGESNTTTEATIYYTITARPEGTAETFLIEELEGTFNVEAGGTVETNSLFTMTTEAAMVFTTSLASSPPSITPDLGDTYIAKKGLKHSSNTAAGAITPSISFTAVKAIKIKVYVTLANDTYNSHRAGEVNYTIAGGTPVTTTTGNRNVLVTISVELEEGQTLVINYKNTTSSTAKLWFFGAEAEVKETA